MDSLLFWPCILSYDLVTARDVHVSSALLDDSCLFIDCRRGRCTIWNGRNYRTESCGWRLLRLSNSTAKMVHDYRDHDNSNGSLMRKKIDAIKREDKEGEQGLSDYIVPPAQEVGGSSPVKRSAFVTVSESTVPGCQWAKEAKRLRLRRELLQKNFKYGSYLPYETSSQENIFSTNGGMQITAPDLASDPAAAELKCGGDGNIAMKDMNNLKIDHSRQRPCSIALPRVDASRNLEEIKQMDSGITHGSIKTSLSEQTYHQPDIHKRLTSIYDGVLIVNNVTVAKEVVRMLTTKYRHLVHACDTEVFY